MEQIQECQNGQCISPTATTNILRPNSCENFCFVRNETNTTSRRPISLFVTRFSHVHVLKCDNCLFTTLSISNLKEHISIKHPNLEGFRTFSCNNCSTLSTEKSLMKEHIQLYHRSAELSSLRLIERFHQTYSNGTDTNDAKAKQTLIEENALPIRAASVELHHNSDLDQYFVSSTPTNHGSDSKNSTDSLVSEQSEVEFVVSSDRIEYKQSGSDETTKSNPSLSITTNVSGSRRRKSTNPGRIRQQSSGDNNNVTSGVAAKPEQPSSIEQQLGGQKRGTTDSSDSGPRDCKRLCVEEQSSSVASALSANPLPSQNNAVCQGIVDTSKLITGLGQTNPSLNLTSDRVTTLKSESNTTNSTNNGNGQTLLRLTDLVELLKSAGLVTVNSNNHSTVTNNTGGDTMLPLAQSQASNNQPSGHLTGGDSQQSNQLISQLVAGMNAASTPLSIATLTIPTNTMAGTNVNQALLLSQLTSHLTGTSAVPPSVGGGDKLVMPSNAHSGIDEAIDMSVRPVDDQTGKPLAKPTDMSLVIDNSNGPGQILPATALGDQSISNTNQAPANVIDFLNTALKGGLKQRLVQQQQQNAIIDWSSVKIKPSNGGSSTATTYLLTTNNNPSTTCGQNGAGSVTGLVRTGVTINQSATQLSSSFDGSTARPSIATGQSIESTNNSSSSTSLISLNQLQSIMAALASSGVRVSLDPTNASSSPSVMTPPTASSQPQPSEIQSLANNLLLPGGSNILGMTANNTGLNDQTAAINGAMLLTSNAALQPTNMSHLYTGTGTGGGLQLRGGGQSVNYLPGEQLIQSTCQPSTLTVSSKNGSTTGITLPPGLSLTGILSGAQLAATNNNNQSIPVANSTGLAQLTPTIVGNQAFINLIASNRLASASANAISSTSNINSNSLINNSTTRRLLANLANTNVITPMNQLDPTLTSNRSTLTVNEPALPVVVEPVNTGQRVQPQQTSLLAAAAATAQSLSRANNATQPRSQSLTTAITTNPSSSVNGQFINLLDPRTGFQLRLADNSQSVVSNPVLPPHSSSSSLVSREEDTKVDDLTSTVVLNNNNNTMDTTDISSSLKADWDRVEEEEDSDLPPKVRIRIGKPSSNSSSNSTTHDGRSQRHSIGSRRSSLLDSSLGKPHRQNFTHNQNRILNEWYLAHQYKPYPSTDDTNELAQISGLNYSQVKKWFANKRARSSAPGLPRPTPPRTTDSPTIDSSETEAYVAAAVAAAKSALGAGEFEDALLGNDAQGHEVVDDDDDEAVMVIDDSHRPENSTTKLTLKPLNPLTSLTLQQPDNSSSSPPIVEVPLICPSLLRTTNGLLSTNTAFNHHQSSPNSLPADDTVVVNGQKSSQQDCNESDLSSAPA